MGLRLSILAVLAGVVWALNPMVDPGNIRCLECHRAHHENLGICMDCHQGNPKTDRLSIAHDRLISGKYVQFRLPSNSVAEDGRRRIEQFACRRCHRIAQSGHRLAADLDQIRRNTLPDQLAAAIQRPAMYMPDFHFPETVVVELVNAVRDSRAADTSVSNATVRMVHFQKNPQDSVDIFSRQCGSCHRMLTQQYGGLGQGTIGPDLSGLLTEFYPKNYSNNRAWDLAGFRIWLKNPREVRKFTPMLPIQLPDDAWAQLVSLFQDGVNTIEIKR